MRADWKTAPCPTGWTSQPISNVVEFPKGQVDPRVEPYRSMVLVAPDHIQQRSGTLISMSTAAEQRAISGKYLFGPGDVLYSKIRPYLRKATLATFVGLTSADMYPLRPLSGVSASLLLKALLGEHFSRFAEIVSTRSGFPKINREEFAEYSIALPPLPEQRQIATILDTLDDAIHKTEQIIAKLKQVKRGLLHDLLTRGIDDNGELRDPERHPEQFKDSALGRIPKSWEATELGRLVDASRPIVYGILMPGEGHPGGVPVVKVKDIKDGRINLDDLLLTSPALDHEYRRSRIRPFDLLFTIRGTVGRTAFVPVELEQANITQDTARIALVRSNPAFVREYLAMPKPQSFIETHTIGVAVRGINLRDVRRIPIAHPPRGEAVEVARRLEVATSGITNETELVTKLRLLKQGLMDDLLTGRVRVTPLLDEAAP